jgi:Ca2+-binding RTX toxin-like protein
VESNPLASITISNLVLASGDTLTVDQGAGPVAVSNGMTITKAQIPTLTYTPAANGNGTARSKFDFTVNDGYGPGANAATMTINVTPINDAPTSSAPAITVTEDGTAATALTASDAETAPANLKFTITALPTRGVLLYNGSPVVANQTITGSGTAGLTYASGSVLEGAGTDSFAYMVTDTGDPAGTPANVLTTGPIPVNIAITKAVADGTWSFTDNILRVGGTAGDDKEIKIEKAGGETVRVKIGSSTFNTNVPISAVAEIHIWGRGGDDNIQVTGGMKVPMVYIHGGDGKDTIKVDDGIRAVVVGGNGDDKLDVGSNSDVLIGSAGKDELKGGNGHDVLVGGTPSALLTLPALQAISDSWVSSRPTPPAPSPFGPVIDTEQDKLNGEGGSDWFVTSGGDQTDAKNKEDALTVV